VDTFKERQGNFALYPPDTRVEIISSCVDFVCFGKGEPVPPKSGDIPDRMTTAEFRELVRQGRI